MTRGTLITLEGIDGSGKSTLAAALLDALRARGHDVHLLREPGGVVASERIRQLVHDPELPLGARAEALLYAASRAQLVEERVAPLLDEGAVVLLDRFVDSSLVYQGEGRQLGAEPVRSINVFATHGLIPDRTLLLDLDPAVARERSQARAGAPDRIEKEGAEFFDRVAAAYRSLARVEPIRFRVINAAQPVGAVLGDALAAIADLVR